MRNAHGLAKRTNVAAMIDELRPPPESVNYTFERHVNDLIACVQNATADKHHSAAVRAVELLGKLQGYYVDRSQVQVQTMVILDD